MKIEIKSFFKWYEVTPEKALEFCDNFMKNSIQTTHIPEERIQIINEDHLRGITYEELKKLVEEARQ